MVAFTSFAADVAGLWCCCGIWSRNCLFGCKIWKSKLKGLYFAARFCFSFSFNFGIDFFDKARWKPNYFQRLCLWHKRNDAISFWLLFLIPDEKMHFGKSDAANHLILFYVKDPKQELHQRISVCQSWIFLCLSYCPAGIMVYAKY